MAALCAPLARAPAAVSFAGRTDPVRSPTRGRQVCAETIASMETLNKPTLVTVASFDETPGAAAFRDRLQGVGIPGHIHDERKLERYWFSSRPRAGVHVQVSKEYVKLARTTLSEWELSHQAWPQPTHCPACYSSRVQFPNMPRKFILPTLVAQVSVWLGLMDHEYYCEDCHYTWAKPSAGEGTEADRKTG
jgi:hypothetical protein